jgi:acyl CoA:acetate/3-ketoacid CoA transferase alpha subunit
VWNYSSSSFLSPLTLYQQQLFTYFYGQTQNTAVSYYLVYGQYWRKYPVEDTISGGAQVYDPLAGMWWRLTIGGGGVTFYGITGAGIPDGYWYEITNVGSDDLTLKHIDVVNGGLGNLLYCNNGGADLVLSQYESAFVQRIDDGVRDGWIVSGLGGSGGTAYPDVEAVDGTPSYTSRGKFYFDEADGFSLSQPGAGQVRIDLLTQMSVTADASGIKLVNDSGAPGNTKLYGTDGAGVRGWFAQPAAISDGDKGDITVSGGGATWTIDADVVTYAKMQNISATSRVLGRKTAGAGDTEELTTSEVLDFASATNGNILARISGTWVGLPNTVSGAVLWSNTAGADPQWLAFPGATVVTVPTATGDAGAHGYVAMDANAIYWYDGATGWHRAVKLVAGAFT